MDIENNDLESKDTEKLLEEEEGKKKACSGKIILLLIFGNIILIAIVVVIVHFVAKNKVDKISSFFNDYLKDLVKIAITPKRIEHLIKKKSDDKYQEIVDIEKKMIYLTWEKIKSRNKEEIKELDKRISDFLFPNQGTAEDITDNLMQILTQKEDYKIYQLLDEDHLKDLNEQLNDNDKREKIEKKLKPVILYALINFPLQMTYFSSDKDYRKEYNISMIEELDPEDINQIFNDQMENYSNISDKAVYMVLGCAQSAERSRLRAIEPFVNITNVGLRVQPVPSEFNDDIKDNFEKYILNEEIKDSIKNLIMDCFADDITDDIYDEFINKIKEHIYDTPIKETKIIEIFNHYNFSIETANTVIEYLKLNVAYDKIHIIKLGEEYRRLNNQLLKYNKSEAYILYNVYDVANALYNDNIVIKRATTEANAKGLLYLQKEEHDFFSEEEYNNMILVSSHKDGERQLEAFNIIFNLNGSDIRFDSVIWNNITDSNHEFNENEIIERFIENVVKSHNLIATNLVNEDEEIKNFAINIMNFTDNSK